MKTHELQSAESGEAASGIRDDDAGADTTAFDFTDLEDVDFPRDADHGTEAQQTRRLAAEAD